jgi:GH43 family beta-xylosidase
MLKTPLLIAFLCLFLNTYAQKTETVSNPILQTGADPWVVRDGETFHYCYVRKDTVFLKSVKRISELKNSPERIIWIPEKGTAYTKEVWAPELHFLDGRWYVYVAADNGKNVNHRMYVLATAQANIKDEFRFIGKISDKSDKWAIDGSPFKYKGKLYFVWSGWEGDQNVQQNLYIAEMDSPISIKSERVLISKPDYEWEKRGSSKDLPTINEGPEILERNGKLFLVYSAAGSWSDYYCLGMLELTGDNPLLASSWSKHQNPVFESNDVVTSPGHASFIVINKQHYVVYHSARQKGSGWNRQVNIQPFVWKNGRPDFGTPVPYGRTIEIKYER